MKQLRGLLLFLSCVFSLLLLRDGSPFISSGPQTVIHAGSISVISHADDDQVRVSNDACDTYWFKSSSRKYNHRTRALNDYHELCLFVPSIRIKTFFVYIPPVYGGYKASYISVAVTLSDWRGPPLA
ncbi:hypothetical protein [Chitinophaga sp. CF418]|uniref:hypothetical protein n=1 Tax=Chitinophaga sp. CF418 TaxID=1855287 RepID=UPI00122CEBE1|nr:hypothetical protein [Chitinophaga sp. CF418]